MISLAEAQRRLVASVPILPAETVPIAKAAGRWLAEHIPAIRTQPARDLSAMDGYAVFADDATSWRVIGESAAGCAFDGSVSAGEAVRIFTGAVLPEGANSIVIQENVAREGDRIRLIDGSAPSIGLHIRTRGSDFSAGDRLLGAGIRLNPARIALLATAGHGSLPVHKRPKVAILPTGSELVAPGTDCPDDKIPESNGTMLAAMFAGLGAEVLPLPVAPDDLERISSQIQSVEADLLVTVGGASVGDHDLVMPALIQCGATMDFWKVAMRPGKPVMAGSLGKMLVIGLPGNPVSAFVTAMLLVEPVIRAMQGAKDPLPMRDRARLAGGVPANGPRIDHLRARMTANGVLPATSNDSAALATLAVSDALIVRPAHAPSASAGEEVEIIRINAAE